jgi:isopropylmalate/homocitrate/citramalate synthase
MDNRKLVIVDQTIREGMQYRGLMFSFAERLRILEFQEYLGVDISQVAYPPAHESEIDVARKLCDEAKRREFSLKTACLCRALEVDVNQMITFGLSDFHLHTAVTEHMLERYSVDEIYDSLSKTVELIRSSVKAPCIAVSLLDIGKTDLKLLLKSADFLINHLGIDILSLPDTSGTMAPNDVFDRIQYITGLAKEKKTVIGVHCHNDMGMATANTIMGVLAGACVVDASALGIGERNGIGDLFIVGSILKEQGFNLNLKTENIKLFKAYYEYINQLCFKKTGTYLLNYNTPFFGDSAQTHVAGTHGIADYGVASGQQFFLNVLCGKHIVKKYLDLNHIRYEPSQLPYIVKRIKDKSVEQNRCLTEKEISDIASIMKSI